MASIKKTAALAVDLAIYIGWTGVGLLNLLFFAVHANSANLAGIFTGSASLSFAFMSVSAFAMLPASAFIIFCAMRRRPLLTKLRGSLQWRLSRAVLAVFAAFFAIVVTCIIMASFPKPAPPTQEIIILGAHVSEDGLSATLHSRLVKGFEHASANPGAKVIVSGGQGLDEPVSEAAAMRDFLVSQGLSEDRIIIEDKSHNTFENLINSRGLLDAGSEPYPITIVTSEFHIFRTAMIAGRVGFQPHFIAAGTPIGILPSCYSREFFGLIKSYFADRL